MSGRGAIPVAREGSMAEPFTCVNRFFRFFSVGCFWTFSCLHKKVDVNRQVNVGENMGKHGSGWVRLVEMSEIWQNLVITVVL